MTPADLEKAVNSYQISEKYFSNILNSQLYIFSAIIVVIVGLYFLFNKKVSEQQIREESEKVKKELRKDLEDKFKTLTVKLVDTIVSQEEKISVLRADLYRAYASQNAKMPDISYLWWLRAALAYSKTMQNEKLARTSLRSATEMLDRVKYDFEIANELGEAQELLNGIDTKKYKIEKGLLEKSLEEAMGRKLQKT